MGKKSQKSTTESKPPEWALPMIRGASNEWLGAVRGNSGNLQKLSAELTGLLPQIQGLAMDTSTLNPGMGYLKDVLGGKYLDEGNPYLEGMIDQTANDVGGRVNATFSNAGRTAGGANQQLLTKELANAENNLRYVDYGNERNAMAQAAGMLPQYQIARTAGINPLMGAYQTAGQLPYYGAQALQGINGLWSGFGKQTTTQPGGMGGDIFSGLMSALPFLGSLGGSGAGAAAGVGMALSDERLKTNITKVGEAKDGLPIVEWNWKSDPNGQRFRGVLAQDVKNYRPEAYVENYRDGYAGVDYAKLGSVE